MYSVGQSLTFFRSTNHQYENMLHKTPFKAPTGHPNTVDQLQLLLLDRPLLNND
jgi:hypothetical protein